MPDNSTTREEAWCPHCGEPFLMPVDDAVHERCVTCPVCGGSSMAHYEESALDHRMGIELEISR